MAHILGGLLSGLLFGLGLTLSGMISPVKVVAFLDVAGAWDPSLAVTMAGAVTVTAVGYRLTFLRARPLIGSVFSLPIRTGLDVRLLGGAAIFGVGWGLGGYCPGPALAGLGFGDLNTIVFVAAMLVGMSLARAMATLHRPQRFGKIT